MEIRVCKCQQCKAKKKNVNPVFKKMIKRKLNKKRRVLAKKNIYKIVNYYWA